MSSGVKITHPFCYVQEGDEWGPVHVDKEVKAFLNYSNIAGYTPLIEMIVGIARIYIANSLLRKPSLTKEARTLLQLSIMRGVIETLSVGFLLIPVDLFFTYAWKGQPVSAQ